MGDLLDVSDIEKAVAAAKAPIDNEKMMTMLSAMISECQKNNHQILGYFLRMAYLEAYDLDAS